MSFEKLLEIPETFGSKEEIRDWFCVRREPHLEEGAVQELLHQWHPKGIFFKSLPYRSCVLDVGAGDGILHVYRSWPPPSRADIKVYGYALEKGQHYDSMDGYELGRWPEIKPCFEGVEFNAIFCSHFVEHIESPADFIVWCAARLPREGRIYLEWPSPSALGLPPRAELAEAGVELVISNYRDDCTHLGLPSRASLLTAFVESGFMIEQTGVVRLPFLEDELLAHFGKRNRDPYARQSAFWSRTYWAQFIVGAKTQ